MYKQLSAPYRSGYHFLSILPPLKQDKWKVYFLPPLGIEDNAKFRIYFVLRLSFVFYSARRYLYLLHSRNIQKVISKNVKMAFNSFSASADGLGETFMKM